MGIQVILITVPTFFIFRCYIDICYNFEDIILLICELLFNCNKMNMEIIKNCDLNVNMKKNFYLNL